MRLLTWAPWLLAATTVAQGVELEHVGTLSGPVDHVRVEGEQLYISAGETFSVVDISNPAHPVRLGSYRFPEQVWGFRIAGDRAYVGANFYGLGILDVSAPGSPRLVGRLETLGQAKMGVVYEDRSPSSTTWTASF